MPDVVTDVCVKQASDTTGLVTITVTWTKVVSMGLHADTFGGVYMDVTKDKVVF